MAHETELWIDIVMMGSGVPETACTLFALQELPMRLVSGESLFYPQDPGPNREIEEFVLHTALGPRKDHSIRVAIDEISHYAVRTDGGIAYKTSVRCDPVQVQALKDVRAICNYMTRQFDFEIDPYSSNLLQDSASEA